MDLRGKMTPHEYITSLGKIAAELSPQEAAQFLLYMRDEAYDNKLTISPVTVSCLADIAYSLSGPLARKQWAAQLGQMGGASTSDAKREASRENGKRGGRPRKTPE